MAAVRDSLTSGAEASPRVGRGVRQPAPADFLIRPVPVLAGAALVLNDHVLKARYGDVITGKLSDAAGLVFAPLLLLAIVELVRAARRAPWPIRFRDLVAVLVLVGGALVVTKLSPSSARIVGDVGGGLRFPIRGTFDRVTITHDTTDLWMLPALAIAWLEAAAVISWRRSASRSLPCTRTSSCADSI